MNDLDRMQDLLGPQPAQPPIENWNPPLSGDIDIRIDSQGRWFHQGTEIKREALRNLFASILRREDDGNYYLLTPVEKWRITVDDAPLMIIDMESVGSQVWFVANTGRKYQLNDQHRLSLVIDSASGEPSPYLSLDYGLSGKLTRSLYYRVMQSVKEKGEGLVLPCGDKNYSIEML